MKKIFHMANEQEAKFGITTSLAQTLTPSPTEYDVPATTQASTWTITIRFKDMVSIPHISNKSVGSQNHNPLQEENLDKRD